MLKPGEIIELVVQLPIKTREIEDRAVKELDNSLHAITSIGLSFRATSASGAVKKALYNSGEYHFWHGYNKNADSYTCRPETVKLE